MSLLCTLSNIHLNLGTKALFKGTGFTISYGDRIGLLGLNGQGKSSLFKILASKITPDHATPPFSFDKANSGGENNTAFSSFLVPQDMNLTPGESVSVINYFFRFYPVHKKLHDELEGLNLSIEKDATDELIERQIDLLEELDHLESWDLIRSFESYLKYFGIVDIEQDVALLSGGEQKKILLSLGFTAKENLILWDEPTNHLDIETIKLFENELMNSNKTFILITHDRFLLGKVSSRIFHIQRGMIETFNGSYTDYLDFLHEQEESRKKLLHKLKNSLSREQAWMRQGVKARGTRSKKRVEGFNDLKSKVSTIKSEARKELLLNISSSGRKTKSLVEFNEANFSFPEKDIFTNTTLNIHKGDRIGLIGKNGVGKTTLVKLILEELKVTSGKFKRAEDLEIQYFSQKKDEFDLESTPFDILGDGTDHVNLPDGRKKHVAGYFEDFLFLKDDLHRPIKTLSGGEKSRLQLAVNLTRSADIWIFDEPTNDLDLETLQILEDTLIKFKGSLVLISHDRSFLSNVTNKTWVIDSGTVEEFVGGYAQAESYLEALALEHIINDQEAKENGGIPVKVNTAPVEEKVESKIHNKNMKVINEKEKEVEKIESILLKFNFESMDAETSKLYSSLTLKKDALEEELLSLYDE